MTEITNHEQCSELLRPYVRGELAAAAARGVEAHLDGCPDCAAEHRALVALQGPDPAGLSDMERARMRRAVLEQAVPPPQPAAEPPPRSDRGARLFPLLGAAAVIVLIAVFAYTGFDGFGGSDESASPGIADEDTGGGDAGGAGGAALESTDERAGDAEAGSAALAAAPEPIFRESIGEVDRTRLNRLGRRSLPLVVFSRAYTVVDVADLRADFVEQIAAQAPPPHADQVLECTGSITSNFPSALPAYGAIGEFVDGPRREVLIVGFAWTDEPEGALDQSMVWAWPLGDCDAVTHYSKNVIEPRR